MRTDSQIEGIETSRGGAGAEHRAAAGALAGSHRMGSIESLGDLKTVFQKGGVLLSVLIPPYQTLPERRKFKDFRRVLLDR